MLSGSITALVTPMDSKGVLDFNALSRLIEQQLSFGTSALVIAGSTGEAAALSVDEYKQLICFVVKHVKERVPVIVGSGTNITQSTVERSQLAESLGANGLLVVTPYYNKPTQQGLYLHYLTVAQSVKVPVYLYNVPARTGCDLLPATVERLAHAHSNIVGLKEASDDVQRIHALLALRQVPSNFSWLSGDDLSAANFILAGGHGVISVAANVIPDKVSLLVKSAQAQEKTKTQTLVASLKAFNQLLFCQTNPIPVKWALHALGLIQPGIRLPLLTLEEQYRPALIKELQRLQLIVSKEYS